MIKAVLFDKDGTLIEFSDIWIDSFINFIDDYPLLSCEIEEIKNRVGFDENNQIIENSLMAAGTISQLCEVLKDYIKVENLYEVLEEYFLNSLELNLHRVSETCDVKNVFKELVSKGYKIGVVTADNLNPTLATVKHFGYDDYVSFVATGDKYPNKPDVASLDEFCKLYDLDRQEVAMVGDSDIDMIYGNSAGLAIGVLTGVGTREMLAEKADIIINDLNALTSVLESVNCVNSIEYR